MNKVERVQCSLNINALLNCCISCVTVNVGFDLVWILCGKKEGIVSPSDNRAFLNSEREPISLMSCGRLFHNLTVDGMK